MNAVDRRGFLAAAALATAALASGALSACSTTDDADGTPDSEEASPPSRDGAFSVAMVTSEGTVEDQAFNQLAWDSLQRFAETSGARADVILPEEETAEEYAENLATAVEDGCDLVWGIGAELTDAIHAAAVEHPDTAFALLDGSWSKPPANLAGVMFRAQESSFLVGYIAARTTRTGKIGFVGGAKNDVIDQFEWGYRGGIYFAGIEQKGLDDAIADTVVDVRYLDSFSDTDLGYATAAELYAQGCDIVFHAAGGAGEGVIRAAVDANAYVIGVDSDQAHQAPDNVLTSALKRVDVAIEDVTTAAAAGQGIGGATYWYGMDIGAVGIPEDHPHIADDIYDAAMAIQNQIIIGNIVPPASESDYRTFTA